MNLLTDTGTIDFSGDSAPIQHDRAAPSNAHPTITDHQGFTFISQDAFTAADQIDGADILVRVNTGPPNGRFRPTAHRDWRHLHADRRRFHSLEGGYDHNSGLFVLTDDRNGVIPVGELRLLARFNDAD
jgi:hypothetical protein